MTSQIVNLYFWVAGPPLLQENSLGGGGLGFVFFFLLKKIAKHVLLLEKCYFGVISVSPAIGGLLQLGLLRISLNFISTGYFILGGGGVGHFYRGKLDRKGCVHKLKGGGKSCLLAEGGGNVNTAAVWVVSKIWGCVELSSFPWSLKTCGISARPIKGGRGCNCLSKIYLETLATKMEHVMKCFQNLLKG